MNILPIKEYIFLACDVGGDADDDYNDDNDDNGNGNGINKDERRTMMTMVECWPRITVTDFKM